MNQEKNKRDMMRTEENNRKIGDGVKRHYQQETKEQKEKRINNLIIGIERRENLKKQINSKLDELFELYTQYKK